MADARDPGFCGIDSAELEKIARPKIRIDPQKRLTAYDFNTAWFTTTPIHGNFVVPFIYGECAFDAMAVAFTTTLSANHRLFVLGWELDESTPMLRSAGAQAAQTFWQLISAADQRRVPVRAMLWHAPQGGMFGENNGPAVRDINGLQYGSAIYDDWLIPLDLPNEGNGIHHQKVVIVSGFAGVIGFIGGMDIQPDRIIRGPADPGCTPPGNLPYCPPMHDVHLKVLGPVTAQIWRIFRERWNDHPDHSAYDNKGGAPTLPAQSPSFDLPSIFRSAGKQVCQVGRTYPNGKKHGMHRSYKFAPNGEHTAWDMIARAIQVARDFIYVEDQYLVSGRAGQALAARLQGATALKRLIILTNNITGLVAHDLPYSQVLRARFINVLKSADASGTRWSIFVLKGSANQDVLQTRGIYVHSKLWIFDDRYAIVGSANSDERGYTHDSECVLGVAEDEVIPPLGFAQKLRMMLWSKHSLVSINQLLDWRSALRVWDSPGQDSMITRYDAAADLGSDISGQAPANIDHFLANVTDPRGD